MKNNFKNLMIKILGSYQNYMIIRKKLFFIANFYQKALLTCDVGVGKLEFLVKLYFKVQKTIAICFLLFCFLLLI